MKTSLALAVAAVLAVPGGASGATYQGKTSQRGGKVSFKTGRAGVSAFRVTASWRCSDGQEFTNSSTIHPPMRVSRRGRFGGRHENRRHPDAGAARVGGRISGSRARGTFSATLRFAGNRPDPKGSALCSTGRVSWSARRR